jgi:hypothetical protein
MSNVSLIATAGVLWLAAGPLHAEEWKHEIAPYLWGAALDGTSGVGDVVADVDVSFSDLLDDLEFGFMGTYRASRDRFSVTVDAVYMGLGATERGPGGRLKADIDLDQVALEANAGYEVRERLVVFGGLRYNDLSAEVVATGPLGNAQTAEGDESWVDPIVGAHYSIPLSDAWSLNLRGDIGGFGIGSDFAWQGVATFRWQFSGRAGALAAYRYMSMDYDDGQGSNRFKYDMAFSGPALGVVFTF